MLLTSVFAANYPGIDKPDGDRTGHWVTLGKSVDDVEHAKDLGGYTANINGKEYVIKDKMLFRSGHLQNADVDALRANNITKVIDLRTSLEALRKPDVKDSKITNVPISMLTIPNLFVMESEDWRTLLGAIRSGIMETWDTNLYRQYIQDPQAIKATKQFFEEVVASAKEGKAVLWHCTAGKDRAGFATAIVLEILGAGRDTITQNYLRTNELIEDDIQRMIGMFFRMTGAADPNTGVALKHMFSARKEYLEAAYDMVEKLYGDFGMFLNEGLGLRDEDISKMREMYLVPSRII